MTAPQTSVTAVTVTNITTRNVTAGLRLEEPRIGGQSDISTVGHGMMAVVDAQRCGGMSITGRWQHHLLSDASRNMSSDSSVPCREAGEVVVSTVSGLGLSPMMEISGL